MTGIQETPFGFRAFVYVKGYPTTSRRFPKTASIEVMQQWRELTRAKLIVQREEQEADQPQQGTFAADAARYLDAVAAMPSIKERTRDVNIWIRLFGDRPRASIRRDEIAAIRDGWLLRGPKRVQRRVDGRIQFVDIAAPLHPGTVNHRLRALSNLWTVLDGRRAPNPVRDVAEAETPDLEPRAIDYRTIEKVLAQIREGKSRARLTVMAYCGIRPAQLMRLTIEDVNLKKRTVTLPSSRKGKKFRRTPTKPLTADGVRAFQMMKREDAFGDYSQSALNHTWQRACAKLKVKGLRAYDLRHSFGTRLLLKTRDLATVAEFLDHGDLRTTQRYTLAVKHQLMHEAARKW
jgi:integrase/recombinase XerD